jgi:hypothetical protein
MVRAPADAATESPEAVSAVDVVDDAGVGSAKGWLMADSYWLLANG